jgi:hypothetical protein
MRIVLLIGLLGALAAAAPTASADGVAHAEMAAALAAQVDLDPVPLALPVKAMAPLHAAPASAVKRGVPARPANAGRGAASAADRASRNAGAQAAPQALAHQAQAAAAAAAGQAQSQRAMHRHPK